MSDQILHIRDISVLLTVLLYSSMASASFYPQLTSVDDGVFRYAFVFTTNGDERLTTGSSITIYDVAPVGANATFSLQGSSDTLEMSLVGFTPPEFSGINDHPDLLNLRCTFRGRLAIDYDLTPNVLFIEAPDVTDVSLRTFRSLTTMANNPIYTVGQVPIPTIVPEAGAMALTAVASIVSLRRRGRYGPHASR
jgi:hypothetical protein